jgi:putative transposase
MMPNKPARMGVVYNAPIRCRRSIRLKGYDYSQSGMYFVTICIKSRERLLGEIVNEKMVVNPCGEMIKKWAYKLEDKFNGIKIPSFVVMPNHFHAIIASHVGAAPCGRPAVDVDLRGDGGGHGLCGNTGGHVGPPLRDVDLCGDTGGGYGLRGDWGGHGLCGNTGGHAGPPLRDVGLCGDTGGGYGLRGDTGGHAGPPLRDVVGWFKTMTTNEYFRGVKTLGWKPVYKRLWQRNYYEHVIRNKQSYNEIAEYIRHNPERWQTDRLYMEEPAMPANAREPGLEAI